MITKRHLFVAGSLSFSLLIIAPQRETAAGGLLGELSRSVREVEARPGSGRNQDSSVEQPGLLPAPAVSHLEHIILHYDKTKYCGHPRMIAFEDFGGGEIVVGHYEAPCKYESYADVRHINYQARAVAILQRSTDGGKTWPRENEVQIFDFSTPPPRREAFLKQDGRKEPFDMFRPGSMFFFTSTYLVPYPPDGTIAPVTFS